MKFLTIGLLGALVSCSSAPEKKSEAPSAISNETFKKERPLMSRDVPDYYSANVPGALSPALQDETLDRFSKEELSQIKDGPDPLLKMAVHCSRGEYEAAFGVASRSFDKYQKVASYWNLVANCHLNQGNHRKALLFYNKALEVSPNYVPALNNIGVLYSRQGQDQKALVAFERASKNSRFSKTPRFNMARLYLTYGLAEEALPVFQALLTDSPQDIDLLNSVASSHFLLGNYQDAAQTFQRIPATQWGASEIGLNFALTLKKLGREADAQKVFSGVKEPEVTALKKYYAVVKDQLGEKK